MANFIKDMSKIKMCKMAKKYKLDYSNILKNKAKKEDIEFFDKEVKKKLFSILLYENLQEDDKKAINNIKILLDTKSKESEVFYTIDQKDMNDIMLLYKIFDYE